MGFGVEPQRDLDEWQMAIKHGLNWQDSLQELTGESRVLADKWLELKLKGEPTEQDIAEIQEIESLINILEG